MKIDGGLGFGGNLGQVAKQVQKLEAQGYHGAMTAETSADPFFPLVLAASELLSRRLRQKRRVRTYQTWRPRQRNCRFPSKKFRIR